MLTGEVLERLQEDNQIGQGTHAKGREHAEGVSKRRQVVKGQARKAERCTERRHEDSVVKWRSKKGEPVRP